MEEVDKSMKSMGLGSEDGLLLDAGEEESQIGFLDICLVGRLAATKAVNFVAMKSKMAGV